MNFDINEVKKYVINSDNRSKIFSVYNDYSLNKSKNKSYDIIKNMYRFVIGVLPYIEEQSVKSYLNNSAISLKRAIYTIEKFNANQYCKKHDYNDFVYKMPILLGYDDYVRFLIYVYNCLNKTMFNKLSDYYLLDAIFNRAKEKCIDLCICTPTTKELEEMLNDPDGDLCSKYEVIINLYNENRLPGKFTISDMPYFIRSSETQGGRTNISLIRPIQWSYNRSEYIKTKEKLK